MKKYLVSAALAFLVAVLPGTALAATNPIIVEINGRPLDLKVAPLMENGRTLIPFRALSEALGATVNYQDGKITAVKNGTRVYLELNSTKMEVNGQSKTMDVAPKLVKGTTLIPARAFAEAFGAKVHWSKNKLTVSIRELIPLQELELDLGHHKEKLVLKVEQEADGMPLGWRLEVNGVEKLKLEPMEIYNQASMQLKDLDGDGKPELLIYRASTGTSGALHLSVFQPHNDWQEIFTGSSSYIDEGERFTVEYLGNRLVSISDKKSHLNAVVTVDNSTDIPEELLKGISTWVDPVSHYAFDQQGNITAVQRIIGVSHAHTLALFQTTYTLKDGKYQLSGYKLTDPSGKVLAETKNVMDEENAPNN